jgi:DNA repair exonuclease SbcCD nuclease subunit
MLVAILTDMHIGYKKNSKVHHDYFFKFYNEIFFPYLAANNIATIIQLGDVTDNRRSLELDCIHLIKRLYYDKLKDKQIHTIVGNHEVFFKDSNEINSPELILDGYNNIKTYSECDTITIDNRNIDLIPWINPSNYNSTLQFINSSKSQIALGHLETNGAMLMPGYNLSHGTDPNIFKKYIKVLSGHIHFRSIYDNIHYIGNPYEMNWGDQNSVRGFTILDTSNLKTKFIKNPYKLHHTIRYSEDVDISDVEKYRGCIIKISVDDIDNSKNLEYYVKELESVAYSVTVLETDNTIINTESFTEDTIVNSTMLELFEEYLQSTNLANDGVMDIIKNIYHKVL